MPATTTHQLRLVNPADRPVDSRRANEKDTGWVCSATGCHTTGVGVLDVEKRAIDSNGYPPDDGQWDTTYRGVCERTDHRLEIIGQLTDRGHYTYIAPAHAIQWMYTRDSADQPEPGRSDDMFPSSIEFFLATAGLQPKRDRGEMNRTQERIFDYLAHGSGDRYLRSSALRQLVERGVFALALNSEVREAVATFLTETTDFCEGGKQRFRDALDIPDDVATVDEWRYQEHDGWYCTNVVEGVPCEGHVLAIARRDQGETAWSTGAGDAVCQASSHRTRQIEKLDPEHRTWNAEASIGLASDTWPIIEAEPMPRPAPFVNDQRATYTFADLTARQVDSDQMFVSVEALLDAVTEYKAQYGLCDAGVSAFLDEFDLSLTTRKRLVFDLKDAAGDRWQTVEAEVECPLDYDPDSDLSDGDIDGVLNEALSQYLSEYLPDAVWESLTWVKQFDSYSRTVEAD